MLKDNSPKFTVVARNCYLEKLEYTTNDLDEAVRLAHFARFVNEDAEVDVFDDDGEIIG